MLNQQTTTNVYPNLRNKLQSSGLSPEEVGKALVGWSPDTAAIYLCQCLTDEDTMRRRRERITLISIGIGLVVWVWGNIRGQLIQGTTWPIFLVGSTMVCLAIWLSLRRFAPLRDNALIGLMQVILEVHERDVLHPLSTATALLDGRKRPWEAEIETAMRSTITRLLTRLSPDEAALLPDATRQFLLSAISDRRHNDLTIAALLTLGSARDQAAKPIAEELRASLTETVREAALEYLQEIRGIS